MGSGGRSQVTVAATAALHGILTCLSITEDRVKDVELLSGCVTSPWATDRVSFCGVNGRSRS